MVSSRRESSAGRALRVVVGFGARADVDEQEVIAAISKSLRPEWRLVAIASVDRKAEQVAAVASGMGVRGEVYSADELDVVPTPTSSERVRAAVGTSSVAEAAAVLVGGSTDLLEPRSIHGGVTIAVAEQLG